MISKSDPYIAPPGAIPRSSYSDVASCFNERIPVVPISAVEGVDLAGDAQVASELLTWAVNAGPDLFRQMSEWALAVYVTKKFADGFVTEAGKDFWHGIRKLCQFVAEKATKRIDEHRKVVVTATGKEEQSGTYFDVAIDIWVPENALELPAVLDAVERVILPLCGCMSVRGEKLEMTIALNEYDHRWSFWVLRGGPFFFVDANRMEWSLANSARSAQKRPSEAQAIRCFESCGLQQRSNA